MLTSVRKVQPTKIVRADRLNDLPWLVHGFSTRLGGFSRVYGKNALNLGFTKDDSRAAVERNRAEFLRAVGAADRNRSSANRKIPTLRQAQGKLSPKPGEKWGTQRWPLVTLRQIHSDLIHSVDSLPAAPLVGDGLITGSPRLLLAIQTADCLPVILVDTKNHAVGVFHAGWRGTLKRIVEKGVGEMFRRFCTRPRDLKAAIGPGIHSCCYQVGEEVRTKFQSQFAYADNLFREVKESDPVREKYPLLFLTARAPGHGELPARIFLDLVEANRRQLLAAGVPAKSVEASPLCTQCNTDLLFSYRGEKGKTGRMMGVAGIRE